MTLESISSEIHDLLTKVSTATLTTLLFKRGFRNIFMQGVAPLHKPGAVNLVGPAFTVRNIPAREDLDVIEAFRDPDHPQRRSADRKAHTDRGDDCQRVRGGPRSVPGRRHE